MLDPDGYRSAPIGSFLDEVANGEPTPGGGAVAALAVAMAAALVSMAAGFARDTSLDAAAIGSEAEALREGAMRLASADAKAYAAVLTARRRPRDDPARAAGLTSALDEASDIPLQVTDAGRRVNALAVVLAASGNPNLRGDALTAAHLAAGAARSAAALVGLNLADPADPRVLQAAENAAGCVVPS